MNRATYRQQPRREMVAHALGGAAAAVLAGLYLPNITGIIPPFSTSAAAGLWLALLMIATTVINLFAGATRAALAWDAAGYALLPVLLAVSAASPVEGAGLGAATALAAILVVRLALILWAVLPAIVPGGVGPAGRWTRVSAFGCCAAAVYPWRPSGWTAAAFAPPALAQLPPMALFIAGCAAYAILLSLLLEHGRWPDSWAAVVVMTGIVLPPAIWLMPLMLDGVPAVIILLLLRFSPRAVHGRWLILAIAAAAALIDARWACLVGLALVLSRQFSGLIKLSAAMAVVSASFFIHGWLTAGGPFGTLRAIGRRALGLLADGQSGLVVVNPLLWFAAAALPVSIVTALSRGRPHSLRMALWSACAFVLMLLAAPYAVGLPLHLPVIILPAALGLFAFAELLPRTSWLLRLIWIMSVAAGTAMLFCGSISPPGTCGIAQPLWRIIYAPLSEVIYHPALSGAGLRCRPGTEFALGVGLFVVSAALAGLTLHSLSARYCRSGSGVAAMLVGAAALLSAPSLGTRFQLAQFSRDFVDSATPQSEANFAKPMEADWLELISFAGSALRAVQGETMAWIEAADSSGQTRFRFPVRAGIETAEWAWDRADLRGKLAHSRAPIAESWTAEDPGLPPYLAHRYLARWPLPGDTEIASVRVDFQVHPGTRRSLALASCRLLAGAPRWQRRLHLAEPMILTPAAPFCEVELGTESAEEILLHVRLEGSGRCRRGGRVALATLTSASATWDYPIELDRHVARTRGPEGGGLRILGSLVLQAPGPAAGHWSPFRISVPPGSRPDSLRLDLSADIIAAAALRLIIGQVETGSHLAGSTSRSGPSGLAQQPLLGSNL